MKRLILLALLSTSAFAQNYSCSNPSESIHFKLAQNKISGSLGMDLMTRKAHSLSFTATPAATGLGSYDLLDAKGSHGKLTIVSSPTHHRSGLLGTSVSVALDYLGTNFKFYSCTVTSDVVVVPDFHQCGRAGCPL